METRLDLDRDMAQPMQAAEPALVVRRRQRIVRDQRDHGGAMAGADLPEVQIGDRSPRVSSRSRISLPFAVAAHVEQHAAGVADQAHGPARDHDRADDADDRIGPAPLQDHRGDQRRDGEHGGRGIGQHMDVGGAQIVVAMGVAVV